jgi:hypothetical protein
MAGLLAAALATSPVLILYSQEGACTPSCLSGAHIGVLTMRLLAGHDVVIWQLCAGELADARLHLFIVWLSRRCSSGVCAAPSEVAGRSCWRWVVGAAVLL